MNYRVECAGVIDVTADSAEEAERIALERFTLQNIVAAHANEDEDPPERPIAPCRKIIDVNGTEFLLQIGDRFTVINKCDQVFVYELKMLNPAEPMREFVLESDDTKYPTEVEAAWFGQRILLMEPKPDEKLPTFRVATAVKQFYLTYVQARNEKEALMRAKIAALEPENLVPDPDIETELHDVTTSSPDEIGYDDD